MKEFQSHMLCHGKGADPVFSSTPTPLSPHITQTCPDQSGRMPLIASGFTAVLPESPFPISPTLQLNGDLTANSTASLTTLGRAELIRHNSVSFRSYTLEADSRVAVLSSDISALQTFVDNYGGVLDITPMLISGYDPEIPTIREVEIQSHKKGYALSIIIKQPIHLASCSHCGSCGPVCPEQCLTESLFLDFSRCTLCRQCEEICPHNAIDIHAVEKRELQVPAILLLKESQINLPEQTAHIYYEHNLNLLFANIYAAEVEEIISWNSNLCLYSSKHNTGCTICRSSCPQGAVSQGRQGIKVDHTICTECGSCLAGCPTGALQYGRFKDADFIEYFRTFNLQKNTTVVLGKEQDLHRFWWHTKTAIYEQVFFLEYPQPGALSSMHLLLLFGLGAARILILDDRENDHSAVRMQTRLVNSVLSALFDTNDALEFCTGGELHDKLHKTAVPTSLTTLYHDFSFSGRRQKLADLLKFFKRQSQNKPVRLTGSPAAVFGEIVCNQQQCTLCNACLTECSIDALSADSAVFSLNLQPILCTQCGTCVQLCPENALALRPGLSLTADFFQKQQLAQAEPVYCLQCGKMFGTAQSLAKVTQVLTDKKLWDSRDNLLQYCDTCRVIQLYESQGTEHND